MTLNTQLESADRRAMSMRRLREAVLRDLGWLLNACGIDDVVDLERYPEVRRSVINFGLRSQAGTKHQLAGSPGCRTTPSRFDRLLRAAPEPDPRRSGGQGGRQWRHDAVVSRRGGIVGTAGRATPVAQDEHRHRDRRRRGRRTRRENVSTWIRGCSNITTSELQYIREMGAEFAEAYPRIAARLGMDGIECADPYVERLIESFAFLAARVQLKLDARHPEFTQHLLEMVVSALSRAGALVRGRGTGALARRERSQGRLSCRTRPIAAHGTRDGRSDIVRVPNDAGRRPLAARGDRGTIYRRYQRVCDAGTAARQPRTRGASARACRPRRVLRFETSRSIRSRSTSMRRPISRAGSTSRSWRTASESS